jgi:hypothetical protein
MKAVRKNYRLVSEIFRDRGAHDNLIELKRGDSRSPRHNGQSFATFVRDGRESRE